MAQKPKAVTLTDSSKDIVNAAINEMNKNSLQKIGIRADGTEKNMQLVGEVLLGNNEWSNQFLSTLLNRIILTVIQAISFENPWKRFKRGFLEAGDAVEEIAITLAEPHGYDSTGDNEFAKQEFPEVYAAIHKINYQIYYKRTINRNQLLRAFNTINGMHDLVEQIISSMYTSAEWDEYISMKYAVGWATLQGYITMVNIPAVTSENMKSIASIVKGVSNNLPLIGGEYNKLGLPQKTDKRNQIVLINANFDATFETEVLAYAFNMDKADIYGTRVFINNYTAEERTRLNKLFRDDPNYVPMSDQQMALLNSIPMYILDDRFFMVFDDLMEMPSWFNGEKLYWNYWLHTWKILSLSPFVNAVGFSPDAQAGTVTLSVTPETLTLLPGASRIITANVSTTGNFLPKVIWGISGNTSANTQVTALGKVTIGNDEKASTVTVTASAASAEGEITASCVITVSGN